MPLKPKDSAAQTSFLENTGTTAPAVPIEHDIIWDTVLVDLPPLVAALTPSHPPTENTRDAS